MPPRTQFNGQAFLIFIDIFSQINPDILLSTALTSDVMNIAPVIHPPLAVQSDNVCQHAM